MLLKIGYDIALKFLFPTAVVYLLHVYPTRSSDWLNPSDRRLIQMFPSNNITNHSLPVPQERRLPSISLGMLGEAAFARYREQNGSVLPEFRADRSGHSEA